MKIKSFLSNVFPVLGLESGDDFMLSKIGNKLRQ